MLFSKNSVLYAPIQSFTLLPYDICAGVNVSYNVSLNLYLNYLYYYGVV